MNFACCIGLNPYKNKLYFIHLEQRKLFFVFFLEMFCCFFCIFGIYKFVKFLKDLSNISITLQILIRDN